MAKLTSVSDDALIALDNVVDYATNIAVPTIRLGVTGLSRAGKTVFITSLVHNLIQGENLPLFEPYVSGRVAGAKLEPQPDLNLPRFPYEENLELLEKSRQWPQSTDSISELRVTIAYDSASTWNRTFGSGKLNIDIVDYPGEWLLDLPLLAQDFAQWSATALHLSHLPNRSHLAKKWHAILSKTDPAAKLQETVAKNLSSEFTEYLHACRKDENALSTLPPGRFLMPGDMKNSPALTFCPLPENNDPADDSLYAQMEKRYEAYKTYVIKPFFRNHFARIDRQVILVDALQAINAGPSALADLETAMSEILHCFNPGKSNWLTAIFNRRVERILFAATKADHLHHENHENLEKVLKKITENAISRAKFSGASVNVMALAALRATREAVSNETDEQLPVIVGTPMAGEIIADEKFDGQTEIAIFPGDLPANPAILFDEDKSRDNTDLSFVKFRPPNIETDASGVTIKLPHLKLDKALQFLLADQLR